MHRPRILESNRKIRYSLSLVTDSPPRVEGENSWQQLRRQAPLHLALRTQSEQKCPSYCARWGGGVLRAEHTRSSQQEGKKVSTPGPQGDPFDPAVVGGERVWNLSIFLGELFLYILGKSGEKFVLPTFFSLTYVWFMLISLRGRWLLSPLELCPVTSRVSRRCLGGALLPSLTR